MCIDNAIFRPTHAHLRDVDITMLRAKALGNNLSVTGESPEKGLVGVAEG